MSDERSSRVSDAHVAADNAESSQKTELKRQVVLPWFNCLVDFDSTLYYYVSRMYYKMYPDQTPLRRATRERDVLRETCLELERTVRGYYREAHAQKAKNDTAFAYRETLKRLARSLRRYKNACAVHADAQKTIEIYEEYDWAETMSRSMQTAVEPLAAEQPILAKAVQGIEKKLDRMQVKRDKIAMLHDSINGIFAHNLLSPEDDDTVRDDIAENDLEGLMSQDLTELLHGGRIVDKPASESKQDDPGLDLPSLRLAPKVEEQVQLLALPQRVVLSDQ